MVHTPVQKHPRFSTSAAVEFRSTTSRKADLLTLDNISLGGAFVRTLEPLPPHSFAYLSLEAPHGEFHAAIEVVHRITPAASGRLCHSPGVGVVFRHTSDASRDVLKQFVTQLAEATRERHTGAGPAMRRPPEFVDPHRVVVRAEECTEFMELWTRTPSRGGLFVETAQPPPLGTVIDVELHTAAGPVLLHAEVVDLLNEAMASACGHPAGAGLRLLDLDAARRSVIEQSLQGRHG